MKVKIQNLVKTHLLLVFQANPPLIKYPIIDKHFYPIIWSNIIFLLFLPKKKKKKTKCCKKVSLC